jgi:hypothetical protein
VMAIGIVLKYVFATILLCWLYHLLHHLLTPWQHSGILPYGSLLPGLSQETQPYLRPSLRGF